MIRWRWLLAAISARATQAYAWLRYFLVAKVFNPCKFTKGFDGFEEFEHHIEHRKEHASFGGSSWTYLRFADRFCGSAKAAHILEHRRKDNGFLIRLDPYTKIAGILRHDGFLGTCHVRRNAMNWFQRELLR